MSVLFETQSTDARQAKKQRKPKRSLRKSPPKTVIDPNQCLGIDMSQKELNDIFSKLDTGQLQNPQQALAKVYSLALDALETTLIDGVNAFCSQISEASSHVEDTGNFFAPWLKKLLPSDPTKIDSVKNGFIERVNDGKIKLQKSLNTAYENDAKGANSLGHTGDQAAQAIRDLMNAEGAEPRFKHPLSDERMNELLNELRVPTKNNPRRFKITEKPGVYHFSFGEQAPKPSAVETLGKIATSVDKAAQAFEQVANELENGDESTHSAETESEKTVFAGDLEENSSVDAEICNSVQSSDVEDVSLVESSAVNSCIASTEISENENAVQNEISEGLNAENAASGGDISAQNEPNETIRALNETVQQLAANVVLPTPSPEFAEKFKTGAEDIVAVATEVTAVMQEIAIQIAQATMQAYAEKQFIPTLGESLKNDPRLEKDQDLCGFIDELESVDADEGDDAVPDNDELANALSILLGDL